MAGPRRRIDLWAWLIGAGIPALLLLGVFSTMPYARMAGRWPLHIAKAEVAAFQRMFDLRDEADTLTRAETIELHGGPDGKATDPRWRSMRFSAEGHDDTVSVRPLRTVDGGWVVRFAEDDLFRTQRQIVLIPATVASIKAKYAELLATELGLITPEVSFVKLRMNGREGIFLKEERIDAGFLEKRRITDGALFTEAFNAVRPDHLFPGMDDDTLAGAVVREKVRRALEGTLDPFSVIDRDAAVAFLLMIHLEERDDPLFDEGLFAYRWTTGRILPLYRTERGRAIALGRHPLAANLFSLLLTQEAFRSRLTARRVELKEEDWRMKERFAAIDKAWLPVLAQGGSLGIAQADADRIKEELLGRIATGPDWGVFAGADRLLPLGPFADAAVGTLVEPRPVEEIARSFGAEVIGDSLVFRRGKYVVTDDLILPQGIALVLEKGVRLALAPGISVLVQGPLITRGTGLNPVFIRPLRKDSAYGAFAVSGNDSIRCELRGLPISGGSEARINGFLHTGMLSIHHAQHVALLGCAIGGSRGEDALNIKHGEVMIRECVFEDGHADLVDLDLVKGEVSDCIFRNGRDDSNGDGLDISGSEVLVRACSFTRMLDKGMSVGEISRVLILDCTFTGNRLGLAVKDLSIAHADGNTFTANSTIFGVYRKKPIYGGGRLFLYGNAFIDNARDREVDALSAITVRDGPDEKFWKSFGLVP